MSIFKEKIEEPQKEEAPVIKKETPDKIESTDGLSPVTSEEKDLAVYETEKGHKFAEKFFDVRNIVAGDKIMRMNIGQIDKHIKSLIEKKGLAKTTDNYSHLLNEIENEIGSSRLETYKRIQKIVNYIKIINKFNKIKELKEQFKYEQTKTNSN